MLNMEIRKLFGNEKKKKNKSLLNIKLDLLGVL